MVRLEARIRKTSARIDAFSRAGCELRGILLDQFLFFNRSYGVGGVNLRNAVTTFTASDFSRTFTSNGDGTDHAWGSHHFVMGGAVAGQNIYGQYPTLGVDQSGFTNPNMSGNILVPGVSIDQYAATLGRWFGMSDGVLDSIFPNLKNFSPRYLGFV